MEINLFRRVFSLLAGLILISSLVTGCKLILVADYDETTDQAVTALQRKMEGFFIDLESKFGSNAIKHQHYADFYKDIKIDISSLAFRAAALPKNDLTIKLIKLLQSNIELMEKIHKTGLSSMVLISEPRNDFNTALANILKLELAKKRGQQQGE